MREFYYEHFNESTIIAELTEINYFHIKKLSSLYIVGYKDETKAK